MKNKKNANSLLSWLLMTLTIGLSSFVNANDHGQKNERSNSGSAVTLSTGEEESDWVLGKEVSNVECYYKIVSCDGMPAVLLKFNNKNSGNVKITWENSYEETTGVFEDFNGIQEFVLQSGESDEVDCNSVAGPNVITHFRIAPHRAVNLTNYSFKNVQVHLL
ncbi:MAG: hypothetical protein H6605_04305 [Flavobacteriales bacterium]|nr:hypothetical protein [Flavobacteriales bacterium]